MRSFLVLFIFVSFIGAVMVGTASGELKSWTVSDWGRWRDESSVAEDVVDGSLQPVESHGYENIVHKLKWRYGKGKPTSLVKEHDAYIWTNSPALTPPDSAVVDGDSTTSTGDAFKRWGANQTGRTFYFDLGSPYSTSRIVFYPRQTGQDESGNLYKDYYLKAFDIFISDGKSYDDYDQPIYKVLIKKRNNRNSIVDIPFPLQPVRFIKLRSAAPDPFEIAEFELYGEGFASRAEYLTKVIDLVGIANYGELEWRSTKWRRVEGDLVPAPDAQVSISVKTRSGNDSTPLRYRAKDDTTEITKKVYERLSPSERDPDTYDRTNWSLWSLPHLGSGKCIDSPGPRRYFQFCITLESGDVMEMARVDSFAFQYSTPPLAEKVVAEIASVGMPDPAGGFACVDAGKRAAFTYDLKADIDPAQYGFDGLRIATPSQTTLKELSIGDASWVASDMRTEITPDTLTIYLPHKITHENNNPLRLIFDTVVLVYGTLFTGEVFNTQVNELPQSIVEGNANDDVSTDGLRVRVFKGSVGEILSRIAISPNPITPNGDGINETATISYTIADLTGEAQVDIGIYDLSGVRVRTIPLVNKNKKSGIYDDGKWDGKGDDGESLPPGVYIYAVSINADATTFEKTGTIAVVY